MNMYTMRDELRRLSWPLIVGLGVVALIRPLMNITGVMSQLDWSTDCRRSFSAGCCPRF